MICKDDLYRLYVEEMKTDKEIAVIFDCTPQSIYNSRKKYGIKAYKRWQRNICNPSQRQIEIIFASLLGDASISNGVRLGKSCQSCFEEKHSKTQKEYLFWKFNELNTLCVSSPKKTESKKWRMRTFYHPYFSDLRKRFYPNGIKIIDKKMLDVITPLGLAVWYMDDGTLCRDSGHMKFCTCSFTNKEHMILSSWMQDRFSISTEIKTYSGYRFLVICRDNRCRFTNTIKDFVIDSMKYKLLDV